MQTAVMKCPHKICRTFGYCYIEGDDRSKCAMVIRKQKKREYDRKRRLAKPQNVS